MSDVVGRSTEAKAPDVPHREGVSLRRAVEIFGQTIRDAQRAGPEHLGVSGRQRLEQMKDICPGDGVEHQNACSLGQLMFHSGQQRFLAALYCVDVHQTDLLVGVLSQNFGDVGFRRWEDGVVGINRLGEDLALTVLVAIKGKGAKVGSVVHNEHIVVRPAVQQTVQLVGVIAPEARANLLHIEAARLEPPQKVCVELPRLVLRGVAGREVHGQGLVGLMFQTAPSIRTDTHLPASCGEVAAGISSARQVVCYLCQSHSSAPLCLFKHTVCSFSEQRITFSPGFVNSFCFIS